MKHLLYIALAFPLLAFGQVGSINTPLMLGTNAAPVSHPGFFDTNAAAIASAVAPVISLDAGRITSGVLPIARIATGTPTGTKFVRDDGTLATPAGGGGGSNFIASVSADFEVLSESLSLTNTTGTGQILRASTLSSYLLSATASTLYQPIDPDLSDLADGSLTGSKVGPGIDAGNVTTGTLGDARIPGTIARLDSPQFTGTVGFEFLQADTVQVPWASRYATANGSSNLVGTLDGGSWTNLNGTEIRSGTVAAARIDSAIARLDSPAFINNPTVPTQSLSTSNTTVSSTAFAQQLAELRQLASTILTQLALLTNGTAGQVPTWTGANTLVLSNPPAGGGSAADVQVFTPGTNTWTKPSGKSAVYVLAIGGGGGGGSGRRGAAGTVRCGGGGGGSGAVSESMIPLSILGSTETVIVGSGRSGGVARTIDDTNGANGTPGEASRFGTNLWAGGGGGGAAGTAVSGAGASGGEGRSHGVAGGGASGSGGAGSNGSASSASPASANRIVGGGGGGGGGITSGDSPSNGGNGGAGPIAWSNGTAVAAGLFGSASNPGSAGGNTGTNLWAGGGGGGGGGGSITVAGGTGGAGGLYGGGGGGGGASLNGNNSGAGGTGGNGVVVVISY